MAETTLPSVRGRDRRRVGLVLLGSGTATGALAGLVLALALGPALRTVLAPATTTIVVLVAVGAGLDGLRLTVGWPPPPTAGRQVPREWARLFPLPVVAALYGARLGVGPLTILSTWTWWSFTLAAALLGPAAGALTGATFGLAKLAAIAAVSLAVRPDDHSTTFGRLRARRRSGWAALTVLTAALALTASACGAPTDRAGSVEPTVGPDAEPTPVDRPDEPPTPTNDTGPDPIPVDPTAELIEPAELEDVVRTTTPDPTREPDTGPSEASELDPTAAAATAPEPRPLDTDLLAAITDYQPIDEPHADRGLDLRAASEIQPDPTEEVALLETRGFEGGWIRAFRNEHNDVAVASVYEFRDEAEAEFYLEDGLITIGGYGGTFFDIPDLPGVRGFAQEIASSDGESTGDLVSLGASFHRDNRWYLLYFLGSPDRVTPEVLVPAIAAQVATADVEL